MYLQTFQSVLLQKPSLPSVGLPALTLHKSPYFQGSNPPTRCLIQRQHISTVTDLGGCQDGQRARGAGLSLGLAGHLLRTLRRGRTH